MHKNVDEGGLVAGEAGMMLIGQNEDREGKTMW